MPCRTKAQELRANMSSNSLGFLTPGRTKILISFGSNVQKIGTSRHSY